jgi:hypothetical protein
MTAIVARLIASYFSMRMEAERKAANFGLKIIDAPAA